MSLLEIKNLHARIGDTEILYGIDLTIKRAIVYSPSERPELALSERIKFSIT